MDTVTLLIKHKTSTCHEYKPMKQQESSSQRHGSAAIVRLTQNLQSQAKNNDNNKKKKNLFPLFLCPHLVSTLNSSSSSRTSR